MLNFIRNIGLTEIIIIVLILIVFFGSKKMSEMAKNAGEATKELKKIKKDYTETVDEVKKESDSKKGGGVT